MIKILISMGAGAGTLLEKLAAQTFVDALVGAGKNPDLRKQVNKIHKAALRVTAARLRKRILEVYDNNIYNWAKHQTHPAWLGIGGSVVMAHLLRANRPLKTMTAKGAPKKRGYSQKPPIKPPIDYPLGGRLRKATRYKVEQENFVVGILNDAQDKVKTKMSNFQDGGVIGTPDPRATQRYFGAIGIPIRLSTALRAKPRPLYAPLVQQYPPEKIFKAAFDDMVADKLRVGD
jgi:hypothetical protein